MAKKNSRKPGPKKSKKQGKPRKNANKRSSMSNLSNPAFGSISTINTAPVSIGNSLRGQPSQILNTKDGAIIVGRDFGFAAASSGTISTWVLVGGMPLNPLAFISSNIRSLAYMYSKFRVVRVAVHYITSSATSTNGDIMFHVRKMEGGTLPQPLSNNFLPYVMSDPLTVLGPQWTNHTVVIDTPSRWLSTDYGATPDPHEYNLYDVFLYSKTTSTDSPGYIIFDYEFEFKQLNTNPRIGNVGFTAGQTALWNPTILNVTTVAGASGATVLTIGSFTGATVPANGFVIPTAQLVKGGIYEVTIDVTNSIFLPAGVVPGTFAEWANNTTANGLTLTDGMVLYINVNDINGSAYCRFYTTIIDAIASANPWVNGTASVTYACQLMAWIKLVTTVAPLYLDWAQ